MHGLHRQVFIIQLAGLVSWIHLSVGQSDLCTYDVPCEPGSLRPDTGDCQGYFECVNGEDWQQEYCSNSENFDVITLSCRKRNEAACVDCSATPAPSLDVTTACDLPLPCVLDTVYGTPDSCSHYMICFTTMNWKQLACPDGMSFDVVTSQCVGGSQPYTCHPSCDTLAISNSDEVTTENSDMTTQEVTTVAVTTTEAAVRTIDPAILELACQVEVGDPCPAIGDKLPDVNDCEYFFLCALQWNRIKCSDLPVIDGNYDVKFYDAVDESCRSSDQVYTCAASCAGPTTTSTTAPTTTELATTVADQTTTEEATTSVRPTTTGATTTSIVSTEAPTTTEATTTESDITTTSTITTEVITTEAPGPTTEGTTTAPDITTEAVETTTQSPTTTERPTTTLEPSTTRQAETTVGTGPTTQPTRTTTLEASTTEEAATTQHGYTTESNDATTVMPTTSEPAETTQDDQMITTQAEDTTSVSTPLAPDMTSTEAPLANTETRGEETAAPVSSAWPDITTVAIITTDQSTVDSSTDNTASPYVSSIVRASTASANSQSTTEGSIRDTTEGTKDPENHPTTAPLGVTASPGGASTSRVLLPPDDGTDNTTGIPSDSELSTGSPTLAYNSSAGEGTSSPDSSTQSIINATTSSNSFTYPPWVWTPIVEPPVDTPRTTPTLSPATTERLNTSAYSTNSPDDLDTTSRSTQYGTSAQTVEISNTTPLSVDLTTSQIAHDTTESEELNTGHMSTLPTDETTVGSTEDTTSLFDLTTPPIDDSTAVTTVSVVESTSPEFHASTQIDPDTTVADTTLVSTTESTEQTTPEYTTTVTSDIFESTVGTTVPLTSVNTEPASTEVFTLETTPLDIDITEPASSTSEEATSSVVLGADSTKATLLAESSTNAITDGLPGEGSTSDLTTFYDTTQQSTSLAFETTEAGPGNCPQEEMWPQASPGEVVQRAICPIGQEGFVFRHCTISPSGVAIWADPIYEFCVDEEYQNVLYETQNLVTEPGPPGDQPANMSARILGIATYLAELTAAETASPGGMRAGNLNASVATLSLLVHAQENTTTTPSMNDLTTQELIDVVSNVLSTKNDNGWNSLIRVDANLGVEIMSLVDEVGVHVSMTTPNAGTVSYITNVVVLEVFPSTTEDLEPVVFEGISSMTIDGEPMVDSIMIEEQALRNIAEEMNMDTVVVWGTFYSTLGNLLPVEGNAVLNSRVIALSVEQLPPGAHLDPPVRMNFTMLNNTMGDVEVMCSFWEYTSMNSGFWSTEGCSLVSYTGDRAECQCDHLTNFAVLMSPYLAEGQHAKILTLITMVGCLLSIVGCFTTLCLYALAWKRISSEHATVMLNLCVVLILANGLFLAGIERTENWVACTAIAALLHYLYLVACMVMLADGVEFVLYVMYVFHVKRRRETVLLLATCYVVPATIVGISLSVTKLQGYGTDEYCWLAKENGLIAAFIGPVILIVLANFVILYKVLRTAASSKARENKSKFWSTLWNIIVILPLLGVTWIFGLISINNETLAFQYLFAICNSLQGFFIFIFHCVLNKKLRDAVKRKFSSTSSATSSMRSNKSGKSKKSVVSNKSNNSGKSNKKKNSTEKVDVNNKINALNQNGNAVQNGEAQPRYIISIHTGNERKNEQNGGINNDDVPHYVTRIHTSGAIPQNEQNGNAPEGASTNGLYCDINEANMMQQNDLNKISRIKKNIRWRYEKSPFNRRRDRFDKLDENDKGSISSKPESLKSENLRNIDVAEEYLTMGPQYYDPGERSLQFINNRAFVDDTDDDPRYMEIDNIVHGQDHYIRYNQDEDCMSGMA